jgi:predicted ATPase/class 3 adenylate cyclase/DNA-binding XRE family transcriptional regulator
MSESPSFGQWLRQRRRALDLTQDELARRAGCAPITIRKLEADESRPSKQLAELLAGQLGIPTAERNEFVQFARAESKPAPSIESTLRAEITPWRVHPSHEAELPSGTVTLLFSDIAVSTILLRRLRIDYAHVLSEQRQLLRQSLERWNGQEVDTEGDAFFAAFARAGDALNAATAAQRALAAHQWPEGLTLRVRMGLHTGEPQVTVNGYVGMDVHRAARICAVAYGGQVLLSNETRVLVEGGLPQGLSLRDLGEHQLKDLPRPEHLFQLVIADLPSDFPPLKSMEARLSNLPVQLTTFVGREREMANITRLLGKSRLVTLTGAGGSGKTRLACEVAAQVSNQFPDGVWFVDLAPLSDPGLVPQAIASALGVREEPNRALSTNLAEHVYEKHMLLLLDNSEHLIEACAKIADTLLHACPNLHILTTSREPLSTAGENTFPIPTLLLPPRNQPLQFENLDQYEGVRLFVDRAVMVQPTFVLTEANAPAVVLTCQQLDGIPLAIELAAARVRALGVETIASRLVDRFHLLKGGSRTSLPRHQTLSAMIDWSYDLLSDNERALLRRLSVFAGEWSFDAAEAICDFDEIERHDVMDLLIGLVNKSMIALDEQNDDSRTAHYRMLETIRQYAQEKLVE